MKYTVGATYRCIGYPKTFFRVERDLGGGLYELLWRRGGVWSKDATTNDTSRFLNHYRITKQSAIALYAAALENSTADITQ